jgi:hypothetical protein
VASPAAALDGQLVAAFDAFADGYRFVAEVTVGDSVATHADGRRVGGNAEFTVKATGSSVTYRTVGANAWVLRPGTDWVAIDGSKTDPDPLAALRAPASVQAGPPVAGAASLVATYPAAALGMKGTDELSVSIVIHEDGMVEAAYTVDTSAGPATSRTTFSALTDTTAIVAPG